MPARLVLFIVLAAALALPAAAFAREGESGGGRHSTKLERPEATEVETSDAAEKPEGTEKSEGAEAPEAEVEGEPANDDTQADDGSDAAGDDEELGLPELPELHPAFLRRSWKMAMGAYGFDADAKVLSASIERISGLPRKLRHAREDLRDLEAAVTVGPRTRVQDERGHRVARADIADALDGAEDVIVLGKVADPKKWTRDEDGEPIVAIAARRIRIR